MALLESYRTKMEEIVRSVFDTMLQMKVEPSEREFEAEDSDILTLVQITGEWDGTVILAMPSQLMMETTAAMLQMSIDEIEDEDLCDVAAELVNVVGGNFKSILDGDSTMSLPSIATGKEVKFFVLGAQREERVNFQANGFDFYVTIYEKTSNLV